jgi:unsaturated rhamnogalacturonyl hydrolase
VYYDDVAAASPFMWSRSNGWAALGLVEMHHLLPVETGVHEMIRRILGQLAGRLEQLQHESGQWDTVLADPRTYFETSATAMISLALKRAVRYGIIDSHYGAAADRAWDAVMASVESDGAVSQVSAETPPGDADFYQGVPLGTYPWGQGFVLLAALDRVANGG